MIPGWVITVTLDCPAVIGWYPGWYPASTRGKLLLNCQMANTCIKTQQRLAIIVNNFLYILLERVIREKSIRCEIRGENTKYFTGYAWWYDKQVNGVNFNFKREFKTVGA